MTQVPPTRYSSAIITRAPYPAAMRAARTPPEPAPITNRSTSKSLIAGSPSVARSERVSALSHLGAQALQRLFVQLHRPILRRRHGLFDEVRLFGLQLLAERRFVEGERI